MSRVPARIRRAVLLRSFAVQASFNYETLIGTGFAFMLAPALRWAYRDDADGLRSAMARHAELFNSHPYLATLAAGAIARLEADRVDPVVVERFKSALRGSLGSIGDQLVWQVWRPGAALVGVAAVLLGAPWWAAVAGFLVVYNALHLYLRRWALDAGLESGLDVARRLRGAPFPRWTAAGAAAAALLGGFACVAALGALRDERPELWVAMVGVPLGAWLGSRTRNTVWAALGLVWAAGLVYRATSASIP